MGANSTKKLPPVGRRNAGLSKSTVGGNGGGPGEKNIRTGAKSSSGNANYDEEAMHPSGRPFGGGNNAQKEKINLANN